MADDVDIDLEKMSLWSKEDATAYFESGGETVPGEAAPPPPPHPALPKPSDEVMKAWFPQWKKQDKPKFRIVCFHNAGSAESVRCSARARIDATDPAPRSPAAATCPRTRPSVGVHGQGHARQGGQSVRRALP